MDKKKLIIIGGGISGLAAGIYAQESGFTSIIMEAQHNAGGNCTGWSRKGYFFEGGMHWLNGSSGDSTIHRFWRETKALNDESKIYIKDPFLSCDYYGTKIHAYRNVDRFENQLFELFPEEVYQIKKLCASIRHFKKLRPPMLDVPGVKVRNNNPLTVKMIIKLIPFALPLFFLSRLKFDTYLRRFKHPAIKLLLSNVVRPGYSTLSFLFIISCFMDNDGGYVEGGSVRMVQNMARYYAELGGELQYGCKAEKLIVDRESGLKAAGVIANGKSIPADAVILAFDLQNAVETFFDDPISESWMDRLWKKPNLIITYFVCVGVKADLSGLPETEVFPVEPFEFAGERIETLGVYNYAQIPAYAPPGCSALTIRIQTDSCEFWKAMKEQGLYYQKKEELFTMVRERLEKQYSIIRGNIDVWDLATPLTYERYCGSWRGCWMTISPTGDSRSYPSKSRSIKGLYFAGHRMMPPGGMPCALITGRRAVQYLCRDLHMQFG